jgi:hypothetical protein
VAFNLFPPAALALAAARKRMAANNKSLLPPRLTYQHHPCPWIETMRLKLPCQRAGVTGNQAQRVVIRWLEMHPEKLHLDFRELAMEALVNTWPCRKQ